MRSVPRRRQGRRNLVRIQQPECDVRYFLGSTSSLRFLTHSLARTTTSRTSSTVSFTLDRPLATSVLFSSCIPPTRPKDHRSTPETRTRSLRSTSVLRQPTETGSSRALVGCFSTSSQPSGLCTTSVRLSSFTRYNRSQTLIWMGTTSPVSARGHYPGMGHVRPVMRTS